MEMRKFKILMIAPSFPPYEFSEALVNAKLCLALMESGHTIHVISRPSEQFYTKDWSSVWEPLKAINFYVDETPVKPIQRYWELFQAVLYFKLPLEGVRWASKAVDLGLELHQKHNYDLVMSRMPSNIAHLVGAKIKASTALPWIANWNDPTENIRPGMNFQNRFQSYLINRFVRTSFRNADLNTFPSQLLWEHYNEKIIKTRTDKVKVIPHIGIHTEGFDVNQTPGKPISICHAGNMLSNVKALKVLKAFSKIKHEDGLAFQFHVFGVIDPEMPGQIESLGLKAEIFCHAPKDYFSMLKSLAGFDYLMILEAPYPKGILLLSKLSDYASIQRPILAISPKVGVIADYLNEYGGGLILDNQDEHAIYEGLRKIISKEISIEGSIGLKSAFSPSIVVKQHEESFNRCLGYNKKSV